jgi:hypothetical protein
MSLASGVRTYRRWLILTSLVILLLQSPSSAGFIYNAGSPLTTAIVSDGSGIGDYENPAPGAFMITDRSMNTYSITSSIIAQSFTAAAGETLSVTSAPTSEANAGASIESSTTLGGTIQLFPPTAFLVVPNIMGTITANIAPGDTLFYDVSAEVTVAGEKMYGQAMVVTVTQSGLYSANIELPGNPFLLQPDEFNNQPFSVSFNIAVSVTQEAAGQVGSTTVNVDPGITLSAVPEPKSLVLMSMGVFIAGVSLFRSRGWLRAKKESTTENRPSSN